MSTDEQSASNDLALSLTKEGARLSVSERILSRLFPNTWAKGRVKEAMADRIAQRLGERLPLDAAESEFFALFFAKETQRNENLRQVCSRAEVLRNGRALPSGAPGADGVIDERWAARFVRDAEDATDETMRDLLARILAGEMDAPGAFSLRTLSIVRDLDKDTARSFQAVASMVMKGHSLPPFSHSEGWERFAALYKKNDIGYGDIMTLKEAGLLSPSEDVKQIVESSEGDACELRIGLVSNQVLVCSFSKPLASPVELPCIPLSVPGSELLCVLTSALDPEYPSLVATWIASVVGVGNPGRYRLVDQVLGTETDVWEGAGRPRQRKL